MSNKSIMELKLIFLDVYPSIDDICEKREVVVEIEKDQNHYSLRNLLSSQFEICIKQEKYITLLLLRDGICFASAKMLIKNETKWVTFNSHQSTNTPNNPKKHNNMTFTMGLIDRIKIKIKCINGNNSLLTSSEKKQFVVAPSSITNSLVKNNTTATTPIQFQKTPMNKVYKTNIPMKKERSNRNNNSNNISHTNTCNNMINIQNKKNQSYEMPANSFISYGDLEDNNDPCSCIQSGSHNINSMSSNAQYQTITDNSSKKKNIRKCFNPFSAHASKKESNNAAYKNNAKMANKSKLNKKIDNQKSKKASFNKSHVIQTTQHIVTGERVINSQLDNNHELLLRSVHIDQRLKTEGHHRELSLSADCNIIKDALIEKDNEIKPLTGSNDQLKAMMMIEDPPEQFEELRNDFELFYTEQYLSNIHDDVLVFELELAIDKVFEMFEAYHNQINHLKNNHNRYKEYFIIFSEKFLKINKELLKMRLEREKSNIDNTLNNFDNSSHKKQCGEMVSINKKEIDIISMIYNCKIEKQLLSEFQKSQQVKKKIMQEIIKKFASNYSIKSKLSSEQNKVLEIVYKNAKAVELKEIESIKLEKEKEKEREKEKEIEETVSRKQPSIFSKHNSTGSQNDKEETKPSSSTKEKTTQNLIQHKKNKQMNNNTATATSINNNNCTSQHNKPIVFKSNKQK